MHRRPLLGVVGISVSGIFAGCVWDQDPVGAGTLVIDNEHDRPQTVTVVVSKTSDDDDDTPPRPRQAPAPTTQIWHRTRSFEVADGQRVRRSGFIAEPGAFYIEVRLDGGESASTWLGLYPASDGGTVGGASIYVDIYEDGRIIVYTPHDD